MLAPETVEHRGHPRPLGVQLGLGLGVADGATPNHRCVDMDRERQMREARLAVRSERQLLQVFVVEVAVAEAHRVPIMAMHCGQRCGVIIGVEQRHFSADQLRKLSGAANLPGVGHLGLDVGECVGAVDTHLVGVGGVITRSATEVALREHAVSSLASGTSASDELCIRTHCFG